MIKKDKCKDECSSKKKIEFSKVLTVAVVAILTGVAIWSIIEYYMLAKLAIINCCMTLPDSTIAITCITTIFGALISYCLYQFGLKNSRNKFGVDCEGQPFKIANSYTDEDTVEDNDEYIEDLHQEYEEDEHSVG